MKYQIIEAAALAHLEEAVNNHIINGWKPQGGVSVTNITGHVMPKRYYTQAMIQESE